MYAQKEALCRRSSVYRNPFIGRALVDALTSVHLKSEPPLSALLSAWKSRVSLKLGAAPEELAALTSRRSLNIEPTSSQISEETLESLKLREKNFERQTTPEPTKQQQKDIPRVTSRDDNTRNSFKPQRHFNLKAGIKQPLFC